MTSSSTGINETTHLLYDACVGFMVSEKTGKDSWEKMAQFVHAQASKGSDIATIKAEFKLVEKQLKQDFKVSALPAAYRSAKTTALSALADAIPFVREDGSALPKTDVSKALAAYRARFTKGPVDYADKALSHLTTTLGYLCAVTTLSGGKHAALSAVVKDIQSRLGVMTIA